MIDSERPSEIILDDAFVSITTLSWAAYTGLENLDRDLAFDLLRSQVKGEVRRTTYQALRRFGVGHKFVSTDVLYCVSPEEQAPGGQRKGPNPPDAVDDLEDDQGRRGQTPSLDQEQKAVAKG